MPVTRDYNNAYKNEGLRDLAVHVRSPPRLKAGHDRGARRQRREPVGRRRDDGRQRLWHAQIDMKLRDFHGVRPSSSVVSGSAKA